jgi:hypothetical protein
MELFPILPLETGTQVAQMCRSVRVANAGDVAQIKRYRAGRLISRVLDECGLAFFDEAVPCVVEL